MSRYICALLAPSVRAIAIACAVAAAALLATARAPAHEGHDHGPPPPTAASPTSPRVVATSEKYQLVGIVEGEVLVVYLDRTEDNAPVTGATIEVSLNGEAFKAELQEKTGTYEVTAPLLRKPGSHEVLVTLSEGGVDDLLVGTLTIPQPAAASSNGRAGLRRFVTDALAVLPGGRTAVSFAGLLLLGIATGGAAAVRPAQAADPARGNPRRDPRHGRCLGPRGPRPRPRHERQHRQLARAPSRRQPVRAQADPAPPRDSNDGGEDRGPAEDRALPRACDARPQPQRRGAGDPAGPLRGARRRGAAARRQGQGGRPARPCRARVQLHRFVGHGADAGHAGPGDCA